MNIALVSREFAPFYGGGIGTYIPQMARALVAAGHTVHVLTEPHHNLMREGPKITPGVIFHAVTPDSADAQIDAYPTYNMRYAMCVYQTLLKLSASVNFDYIEFPDYHGEGYFTTRAKRTLGRFASTVMGVRLHTPTIYCRDADETNAFDREFAVIDHMEFSALRECDLILSPSHATLRKVRTTLATSGVTDEGWPWRREEAVLPLPLDIAGIERDMGVSSPEELEARHTDQPGKPITVVYYGRMQRLKGVHDIVRAAQVALEQLAGTGIDLRFRLIGKDTPTAPYGRSMLEYLKRRVAAKWADRFSFESAMPRSQLGAVIRSSDIACFPSHWDSFPMASLEAMAMGCALVVSDAGGLPEIVQHNTSGLIVPAGDYQAIADAFVKLAGSAQLRRTLAHGALARVRELGHPAQIVKEMERLIAKLKTSPLAIDAAPGAPGPAAPAVKTHASTDKPAVSVVIPYYNMGAFLPQTLESIRQQTFRDFEVVVLNDGSTDEASLELLARLEQDAHHWPKGLRVVSQPNAGLGAARNAGFRAARAELALAIDADDLIHPKFLETCVGLMRRDPGLSFATTFARYFAHEPGDMPGGWLPFGLDRDILPAMNVGGCSCALVRVDAWREVGGWEEWSTAFEDWDFWCRLAERNRRGLIIPEFWFYYRVRTDSMFRSDAVGKDAALRSHVASKHTHLAKLPDRSLRIVIAEAGANAREAAFLRQELNEKNARIAELEGRPAPTPMPVHLNGSTSSFEVEHRARQMIEENIRYRVADRLNELFKRSGLHRPAKGIASSALALKRKLKM